MKSVCVPIHFLWKMLCFFFLTDRLVINLMKKQKKKNFSSVSLQILTLLFSFGVSLNN